MLFYLVPFHFITNLIIFLFLKAGSEEGYVCLFEICEEGLMYYKVFDKQEGNSFILNSSVFLFIFIDLDLD